MADNFNGLPNAMDEEFDNFWKKVSCFAAANFPFEERCEFVRNAVDCNKSTNVVPYMTLLACELKCVNKFEEMIFISLFMGLCFEILVLLIYTINDYYSPALKAVSRLLHMNEHLAGVTLMAFGNSSADLFSNLASVKRHVPVLANSLSSALFVTMITGGLICYITPFKMNAYETVRDILFLVLGTFLMDYFTSSSIIIKNEWHFLLVAFVYIVYILINVTDVYLLRRTINSTANKIQSLMEKESTPKNLEKIRKLEEKYDYYSQDGQVEIYERDSKLSQQTKMRYTTLRMARNSRVSVNRGLTRIRRLDMTQPRNRGIFKDFFLALRPIKCQAWRQADILGRTLLLIRAPAVILCTLYIPLVDYEMDKHGWNKLLNCLHVIINPAMSILVLMSFLSSKANTLWYMAMQQQIVYGAYSLVLTVPFFVFILIKSRTDVPPSYHWIFTLMNLTGSMFIIFICATEIDKVLEVIANVMAIDDDFMGATVKAFTGNLSSLFANTAVAAHGYPKMAFASAIGGSFFTIVVTGNTVIYVRSLVGQDVTPRDQMEDYGLSAFLFLNLGLFTILLWSTTLGFFARRSMGLYSIALYSIYLVFAILVHEKVIHSFADDPQVSAAFGDI
ncbi:mitochondrial sodium/calcium exchanger protein isoform X1 [Drosophila suzukii]|uniref:Mitochondrial sodium/calcium exchanger protein isoform X1 n=1 Tax=Drosophila suzukii TaxID=28584 RepID=A0AB39Z641_DROSZ